MNLLNKNMNTKNHRATQRASEKLYKIIKSPWYSVPLCELCVQRKD